jgi:hypothetical protein
MYLGTQKTAIDVDPYPQTLIAKTGYLRRLLAQPADATSSGFLPTNVHYM